MAAYSLGASKTKIQQIFDEHASYQKPAPPFTSTLTRENYKEHLGKSASYTNFLNLFQSEVEKHGSVDTVRRWVWSGDMLARTIGGVYHPLIHIGYGLEFDIPGIIAEGLAMAACTENYLADLIPEHPGLQTALLPTPAQAYAENATSIAKGYVHQFVDQLTSQLGTRLGISEKLVSPSANARNVTEQDDDVPVFLKENTLLPIFNKIRKDAVFDNLVKFTDDARSQIVLSNKAATARIKEYVDQWTLEENSKDIQAKFKDLYSLVGIALGSTGIRKDHPNVLKLDFFMMHSLTSTEFLHHYIDKVTPSEAVSLLRAHLSATLLYFISNGRPAFDVEALLDYKSPLEDKTNNNNWFNVLDKSLNCMEPHVIKAVRACTVGQIIYGPNQDTRLNAVWLKVAQMVVEMDGTWDFSGLGFKESWSA